MKIDTFVINPLKMDNYPEDLRKEIKISLSEVEDAQILELLILANRPLNLNELLVGAYTGYNVIYKRNILTSKIYRLVRKGFVKNAGKGKYKISEDLHN